MQPLVFLHLYLPSFQSFVVFSKNFTGARTWRLMLKPYVSLVINKKENNKGIKLVMNMKELNVYLLKTGLPDAKHLLCGKTLS